MFNDKKLKSKQVATVFSQGFSIISFALIIYVLTRAIGPEGFAQLGMVMALSTILATALQLGVIPAFTRKLAVAKSKDEQNNSLMVIVQLKLMLYIPVLCLFGYFSDTLVTLVYNRSELSYLFRLALLSFFLINLVEVLNTFLIGINQTFLSIKCRASMDIVRSVTFVLWPSLTTPDYFIILTLSALIEIIVILILVTLKLNYRIQKPNQFTASLKTLWPLSGTSYGTKLIYAVWDKLPILFLANTVDDRTLGQLELALRIAEKFRALGGGIAKINNAHLSKAFSDKGVSAVRSIAPKNFLHLNLIFGGLVVIALVIAEPALTLIAGHSFGDSQTYFIYTLFLAYVFLQITWMGSSVLYPLQDVAGLVKAHFSTKLSGAVTILLIQPQVAALLIIMIGAEALMVGYYAYRYRRAIRVSEG